MRFCTALFLVALIVAVGSAQPQQKGKKGKAKSPDAPNSTEKGGVRDARDTPTGQPLAPRDPEFAKYGIYEQSAPRPTATAPIATTLPLDLKPGDHIAFIGNTLFERAQLFGHVESLLHQRFPKHNLVIRNLSWSADTIDLAPRPANFADVEQHLLHERTDVILAAYGFNESFAGDAGLDAFRGQLTEFLAGLKTKSFNGRSAPRIVLVSPIANENIPGINAADLNNDRIQKYIAVMREVAARQ